MDTENQKEALIPYMIYAIEKKIGKELEYNDELARDAQNRSKKMAEEDKILRSPEKFLSSDELVGSITVETKYLKIGLLDMVNKWFKYEENKQKVMNASKTGIGIETKELQGKTTAFVTKKFM